MKRDRLFTKVVPEDLYAKWKDSGMEKHIEFSSHSRSTQDTIPTYGWILDLLYEKGYNIDISWYYDMFDTPHIVEEIYEWGVENPELCWDAALSHGYSETREEAARKAIESALEIISKPEKYLRERGSLSYEEKWEDSLECLYKTLKNKLGK